MELESQSMMSREAGLATTIYLYLLCLVGGFAKELYHSIIMREVREVVHVVPPLLVTG